METLAMIVQKPVNELQCMPLGDRAIVWTDKRGALHSISAEGATFKGGLALKALRDAATEVALEKAIKGRYRAAADIMGTQFPAVYKAAVTMAAGRAPDANKHLFVAFCAAVLYAKPKNADKGWTDKQLIARELAGAYLNSLPEEQRSELLGYAETIDE